MPERPLIVVDAANVIGTRPDGWWHDRAGATRRLLTALARGFRDQGDVVLILEGAARAGADAGVADSVRVVHAPDVGDNEIVRVVAAATRAEDGRPVIVVTADRALRERVRVLGAATVGPHWLWARLTPAPGRDRPPTRQ